MNYELTVPFILYFYLGVYSTFIFYMRKTNNQHTIANIFSILHVLFYIFFAFSQNILSAILMFLIAEIISLLIIQLESSLIATRIGDDLSIEIMSKSASLINGLIIILVLDKLMN